MSKDLEAFFRDLRESVSLYGAAPNFAEMPRRTLSDKGIAGPTAAHVIEEVHVPHNLAGLSFTTGTSAFQNIVGITATEIPLKAAAARRVLAVTDIQAEDRLLFCYPPLVNVFTRKALESCGVSWFFLERSSRDAFLSALYTERPTAVMGESSFIKAALEDAEKLGITAALPQVKSIMVAGTPLDTDMPALAKNILNANVYDVYGCQEFGWLTVNGEPIRGDLSLITSALGPEFRECVVGGLPTGDSFPITGNHHLLNPNGNIITYRRKRTRPDYEVVVLETPLTAPDTLERAARTILRLKARAVKIHPNLKPAQSKTVLWLKPADAGLEQTPEIVIAGPEKTTVFDALVQAQVDYQAAPVRDPAWLKRT